MTLSLTLLEFALLFGIFFGGMFSLIMAGAELFRPKTNIFLVAMLLSISGFLVDEGLFRLFPASVQWQFLKIASFCLFTPFCFLYYKRLLNPGFNLNTLGYALFLPALVFFFAGFFPTKNAAPLIPRLMETFALSYLLILGIFLLIDFFQLWRYQNVGMIRWLNIMLLVDFCTYAVARTMGIWYFPELIVWSSVYLSMVLVTLFLISGMYDNISSQMKNGFQTARYSRSRLDKHDLTHLETKLSELLGTEKLYLDEDLKLESLAEEMDLSPHQLSEFINTRLEKSFFNLINEYRIIEAQKVLLANPDKTVLTVAFEVGFNNRASFNSAFLKFAGTTPVKFRKKKIAV